MGNYKGLILEDYLEWVKLNSSKKFSLFDYINGIAQLKDLSIDVFVAVLKLFWPDFINIDNKIFIKEEFSEEKYKELLDTGYNDKDLEYWMNLINLDGLFQSESFEIVEYLGKYIEYFWEKKLKEDFPDKNFVVQSFTDSETDEIYVYFYQVT